MHPFRILAVIHHVVELRQRTCHGLDSAEQSVCGCFGLIHLTLPIAEVFHHVLVALVTNLWDYILAILAHLSLLAEYLNETRSDVCQLLQFAFCALLKRYLLQLYLALSDTCFLVIESLVAPCSLFLRMEEVSHVTNHAGADRSVKLLHLLLQLVPHLIHLALHSRREVQLTFGCIVFLLHGLDVIRSNIIDSPVRIALQGLAKLLLEVLEYIVHSFLNGLSELLVITGADRTLMQYLCSHLLYERVDGAIAVDERVGDSIIQSVAGELSAVDTGYLRPHGLVEVFERSDERLGQNLALRQRLERTLVHLHLLVEVSDLVTNILDILHVA